MGKRLPKSRKHKKLKFVDPCYKGQGPRSQKKNLPYNEPPAHDDVQDIPRGMQQIMDFKNNSKLNNVKKKQKKRKKTYKDDFLVVENNILETNQPGMEKAVKKMPRVLKQRENEDEKQFINRLQKMADKAKAEAKIEEKYNIELVNVDKDGNAQYKTDLKEVSDGKREKRKRYKEKLQEKKRLRADDGEFDLKKESIQFGDVAAAPPFLTSKPRKAPEMDKPGKKKLALNELLEESKKSDDAKPASSTKWKDLSPDKRKEIEHERSRAVQMYRLMKNKRTKT